MIRIQTAHGTLRRAAVALLLSDVPSAERERQVDEFLAAADTGTISLEGLLVAEEDRHAVGAVLFALQPDGCAFVWPPRAAESAAAAAVCDRLLQEVGARLDAAGAWIGQCMVEPDAARDRDVLQRNGFAWLTDLHYLRRPFAGGRLPRCERPMLEIVRRDPERHAATFGAMIDRTYRGSIDCPGLNGLRTGLEAVAGHKMTGECLPEQWMIFRHEGKDVGLLIFAEHADQDAWELVYMGVVPEARGRGFGREIVLQGLHAARKSGRSAVLLAVDGNNHYARRIYESVGFQQIAAKSVHARPRAGARERPE